jgi:YidC/Oxa1 family membrane protein insertase
MDLWHLWISTLANGLSLLASQTNLSEAMAIILLTIIARICLMPISLTASYRMELNKQKLKRLKPDLDRLRAVNKDNPAELASQTMQFYRHNGIGFFDRLSLLNAGSQGIFGLGIFQALNKAGFSSPFLWIATIAKPDVLLTFVVGLLMLVSMAIAPGALSEPSILIMLAVSVVVAVVAVAALPSAIGIYWAASSAVNIGQEIALRGLLSRQRVRSQPG